MINKPKFFSLAIGLLAAAGLFLFYSLTMRLLAGSWAAAWWQFRELWFLMLPLVAGFGVQIGLFSYIKFLSYSTNNKMIAASSATSTVSMIACCAHHLADVVPILGLSALSLWLVNFQKPLLILGILSNLTGSLYMIRILRGGEKNLFGPPSLGSLAPPLSGSCPAFPKPCCLGGLMEDFR